MQLARLFLRGSLCNKTMRGLSRTQQQNVQGIVNMILSDPALTPARQSFLRALGNTIGNEYKDPSFADEEAIIAIWRAVVSALYHKPIPGVIENGKQRKKFFQEWIFNSLRQILNENKIPQIRTTNTVCGLNTKVGAQVLSGFLIDRSVPVTCVLARSDKHIEITAEVLRLSLNELQSLWRIEKVLRNNGVKVVYDDKHYNVVHIKADKAEVVEMQIPAAINIKIVSFESKKANEEDDRLRYTLEYKMASESSAADQRRIEFNDFVEHLKGTLPSDAKEVLNIIVKPPQVYIRKHGDDVRQKTVANFLRKTPKEMARIFDLIRLQCLGAGYTIDKT